MSIAYIAMEQKKLVISFIIISLIAIRCNNNQVKIEDVGLAYNSCRLMEEFKDNAGVCAMRKYSLSINYDKGMMFKENNLFIDNLKKRGWEVKDWTKEVDIDLNFIYNNFKNINLKKDISESEPYFLYGYKGKKRDLYSIKIFVLIPEKEMLYYFEIIP